MRLRGLAGVGRIAKAIKRRLAPQVLILLYHRVARVDPDPWMLCVTPEHFAEHLDVLRRQGLAMSLKQLTRALHKGRIPRRAVVVTFDDGYADNLLTAAPLLQEYEVPATVFVATGYVGHEREFWWDELERLFLQPGSLPDTLRLSVDGKTFEWELHDSAHYGEAAYNDHRHWKPWHKDSPGPRQSIYHSLWQLMHPMSEPKRLKMREEMLAWAGSRPMVRPTHRTLSREEVMLLARGGLVDVGAHTVTHPMLSALPERAQREEIQRSKAYLEDVLNQAVSSFAYPYGRECDYTDETVAIVRQAGFDCACTTSAGLVGGRADLHRLPRIQAQDVDGEVFARQLAEWFGA